MKPQDGIVGDWIRLSRVKLTKPFLHPVDIRDRIGNYFHDLICRMAGPQAAAILILASFD